MKNRPFVNCIVLLVLFMSFSCDPKTEHEALKDLPNILLILTDDQGYGDLGFHGNPIIQTPFLDQLAKESVRFTNFYVSPVCSPTRASLMTGRYHLRTGVYDTYMGGSTMATEEITLAEILNQNGFRTGLFGKWHLGDNYPYRPQDQGFDEVLTHIGGGLEQPGDFFENFQRKDSSYFDPYLIENGKKIQKEGYVTDILTDEAIAFMDKTEDAPFFCYLAYNAPHGPLEVPQDYLDQYDFDTYPVDSFSIQGHDQMDEMQKGDLEKARRVYAMLTNVDDNIGRIRKALEDNGKAENTLIIFLTDNGPAGRRYVAGMYGRKGSIYEGGTRAPSFWYFPEKKGAQIEIDQLAAHIDVVPTLLDVLDLKSPPVEMDGMSLKAHLNGEAIAPISRSLFMQWNRGFPELYQNFAVRTNKYKLTGPYLSKEPLKELQLFDLEHDPFEENNLAQALPEEVSRLKGAYEDWMKEMRSSSNFGAPRPAYLSNGPVRLNRNDWEGPNSHFWGSMEGHGGWKVYVEEANEYNFRINFQAPVPGHGQFRLRAGMQDRTIANKDTTLSSFLYQNVYLTEGEHDIEAWYYEYWPQKEIYGAYEVLIEESK
ncbi:MAG: arylsulfatase [Bacteroidota bacterium]